MNRSESSFLGEFLRWRFWALAAVLCFAASFAHAGKTPRVESAPSSLLFIGPILEKQGADETALTASIHQRIMAGLRSELSPDNRFTEAISAAQIEQERSSDLTALTTLRKSDFNRRTLGEILNRFSKSDRELTGYLRPTVRRASGHLEVDLELYKLDGERFELERMVSVGGCGMSDSAVLDALFAAARSIASGRDEPPVVAAHVTPSTSIKVGEAVTLSSCGSIDPNHDAMTPLWRVREHPTAAVGIPRFAVAGRVFQFTPTAPGDYRVELTISGVLSNQHQVPGSEEHRTVQLLIRAFEPPDPRVRAGKIIDVNTETTLELESEPQMGVKYRWRQTSGPLVELQRWDEASASCQQAACQFVPKIAGKYSFELTAQNELGVVTREVNYLVTDVWGFESSYLELDTATHLPRVLQTNRVPAQERRYIWKLRYPASRDGVNSSEQEEEHAWLFGADTATPTFLADRPGVYTVEVTSATEYELDGKTYEKVLQDQVTIAVEDRSFSARWVPSGYLSFSRRYAERTWLYASRLTAAYAFRRESSETSFGPRASIGLLPIRLSGEGELDTSFDIGGHVGYRLNRVRANFLVGYERVGGDFLYAGSDFVWAATSLLHVGLELGVGVEANVARPPTLLTRAGVLLGVEL